MALPASSEPKNIAFQHLAAGLDGRRVEGVGVAGGAQVVEVERRRWPAAGRGTPGGPSGGPRAGRATVVRTKGCSGSRRRGPRRGRRVRDGRCRYWPSAPALLDPVGSAGRSGWSSGVPRSRCRAGAPAAVARWRPARCRPRLHRRGTGWCRTGSRRTGDARGAVRGCGTAVGRAAWCGRRCGCVCGGRRRAVVLAPVREHPRPEEQEAQHGRREVGGDEDRRVRWSAPGSDGRRVQGGERAAGQGEADAEDDQALRLVPDGPAAAAHPEGQAPVGRGVGDRRDQQGERVGDLRTAEDCRKPL